MSKRNLQRALRIERNLTDSMKELLDNGEIYHCIGSMVILHLDVKDVDIRKLIFETYKHLDSEIPLCKKFNSDCSRWIELEQFQKWDCFKFIFVTDFLILM